MLSRGHQRVPDDMGSPAMRYRLILSTLIVFTIWSLLSCSQAELPPGFRVLDRDLCLYTSTVFTDLEDRPSHKDLRRVVAHQQALLLERCPKLETIEIVHLFNGAVWRIDAKKEDGWELSQWRKDDSFRALESIAYILYDEFIHTLQDSGIIKTKR